MVQADGLPSTFAFEGGGDSQGSRDYYLDLNYAFVDDLRLLASVTRNRSDSQNNPITTRSILLGFRTDPLEPLSVGVDLETWGKKGALETDTLRIVMDVSLQHWQFSLRPQWRTLTISRSCVKINQQRCQFDTEVIDAEVKSTGMSLDVSYYTNGPWSFSLSFARHQYDEKEKALGRWRPFQFSPATLELATGLESRRRSVAVFYFSDNALWSFSRLKSIPGSIPRVTSEASFIHTLRFSTDLNEQWRLRLRVGNQTLEKSGDQVNFASVGVTYRW